MTIDVKWGLPFVLPFLILAAVRLLVFCAGLPRSDGMALGFVLCSLFLGILFGLLALGELRVQDIRWEVAIGQRRNNGE